jgi:hypothetical protein
MRDVDWLLADFARRLGNGLLISYGELANEVLDQALLARSVLGTDSEREALRAGTISAIERLRVPDVDALRLVNAAWRDAARWSSEIAEEIRVRA